ncbi:MAG: undecaprenyl-diphosphate phosphatase, partial [Clostridiales bacterium]|nr:undecaprenyl-diphosphate phosphatase [Clostridiales bacterium]
MSLLQALLLGLVQGITEFLPVSSSGHLAIMQNLLNINTDTGVLFDVILHLGTLT